MAYPRGEAVAYPSVGYPVFHRGAAVANRKFAAVASRRVAAAAYPEGGAVGLPYR